jgi:ketosteroid isomerase-like protein
MFRIVIPGTIITVLLALLSPAAVGQDPKAIEKEIEQLNAEKTALTLEGNFESLEKFYVNDAISLPNYNKMVTGVEDIISFTGESGQDEYKVSEIKLKPVRIFHEDSLFIEVGNIIFKVSGPGIPGKIKEEGKYMTLWERQADGSLKIKAETWNVDVNPLDRMPGKKKERKARKKGKKN